MSSSASTMTSSGPGPNQVRNARGWAASRRRSSGQPGIRLYAAESVPAATGAMAGARLIADASRMALLAEAFANKLGVARRHDAAI